MNGGIFAKHCQFCKTLFWIWIMLRPIPSFKDINIVQWHKFQTNKPQIPRRKGIVVTCKHTTHPSIQHKNMTPYRFAACSSQMAPIEQTHLRSLKPIRVILQFIMSFGRGLVALLTKPSMFGKLKVHVLEVVWKFEPITSYIGSLRVKLILTPHCVK